MIWPAPVLTKLQLERLAEHKYSSQGTSMIEPLFQPLWNWQVQFVPSYIHPNILTICGFLFILSGLSLLICHSPDLKHEIPAWCFIYNAFCIFMYQSLDAIDGKHARRQNLCSPIGELFDHGFDALTAVALTMEFSIMIFLGNTVPLVFASLLISLSSFFFVQWEYYCTGYMHFNYIDGTEYMVLFMILNIATAVFGQRYWEYQIVGHFPVNNLFVCILLISSVSVLLSKISSVLISRSKESKGTTVAGTSVAPPIFSMILIIIMYISIFLKSTIKTEISKAFVIYHFLFGVTISKITVRLIVATMTKSEFHVVDTEFIVPALTFFNQYFGYIFPETISVIYIGLLFNICNFAYFLINLTILISNGCKYSVVYVPNNEIA